MDSQGKGASPLLHELLDCVEDLILILDAKLRVVDANRGAAIFFGYTRTDLLKTSLPDLVEIGERKRMSQFIAVMGERQGGATIFLTQAKKKIPTRFSLSRVSETSLKTARYLLVARRSAGDSIRADGDPSNGLAIRMLNKFAGPLFIIDGPSRIVRDCNEAALSAFGFSREELVGRRLLDRTKYAGDKQRIKAQEERADAAYATMGIFQERVLFARKDAPPAPYDLTGLPFFKPDGSLDIIIAMLYDRSVEEERETELSDLIGQVSGLAAQLASIASTYSTRDKRESLSELGFTTRQIEIARQVATGASSKDIGFSLGVTESTVKNHLAVMYRKLRVNSRIGFVRAIVSKRIKME
jgi:PAS domain-containing protein/DNA-binding CsgD family transcriptional regulator